MEKKKPDTKFSHMETDNLRATMTEDEETQKNWKDKIGNDSILIDLDDGSHPAFKGAQIKLESFSTLKDPAGDPVSFKDSGEKLSSIISIEKYQSVLPIPKVQGL